MKKQISAYILSLGGQPHYSGNSRTMYITDPERVSAEAALSGQTIVPKESIESCIYRKYGFDLPFTVKTN